MGKWELTRLRRHERSKEGDELSWAEPSLPERNLPRWERRRCCGRSFSINGASRGSDGVTFFSWKPPSPPTTSMLFLSPAADTKANYTVKLAAFYAIHFLYSWCTGVQTELYSENWKILLVVWNIFLYLVWHISNSIYIYILGGAATCFEKFPLLACFSTAQQPGNSQKHFTKPSERVAAPPGRILQFPV